MITRGGSYIYDTYLIILDDEDEADEEEADEEEEFVVVDEDENDQEEGEAQLARIRGWENRIVRAHLDPELTPDFPSVDEFQAAIRDRIAAIKHHGKKPRTTQIVRRAMKSHPGVFVSKEDAHNRLKRDHPQWSNKRVNFAKQFSHMFLGLEKKYGLSSGSKNCLSSGSKVERMNFI
jgi:hypothetical protein